MSVVSDTWIIFGVQFFTALVCAFLSLISVGVCGGLWAGLQKKRNPRNEELEPWDENKKDFLLSYKQIGILGVIFTILYIILAKKYIDPHIINLILGR